MPEPLASYSVSKGAKLIISDDQRELNSDSNKTSEKNGDAVKMFMKTYAEAVGLINSNLR